MEIELWMILFMSVIYFVAGFIDSVAGGGGLIALPAYLVIGIPADFALGTNKLISPFGTMTSLLVYSKSNLVAWQLAIIGIPLALLGGYVGAESILLFETAMIEKFILFLLPFAMLLTFLPNKASAQAQEISTKKMYIVGGVICFSLGFYNGFFGPGTGSFLILAFNFFLGMSLLNASATAKIFNFTAGIGSLFAFVINGKVLFLLAIPLIISAVLGNITGSKLAIKIGSSFVRKILIISLCLLMISLALQVLK